MAMARKAAFFPALLPQPSLGWDSFLCLGVLVWPRSDLPLALIRKYLPDGPSPRGLWVPFMKMKLLSVTVRQTKTLQMGSLIPTLLACW